MTKEEKELLLKDLCARLLYGVKVQPSGSAFPHKFVGYDKSLVRIDTDQRFELENIKPYLRPMSSMTEEERKDFYENLRPKYDGKPWESIGADVDWLNNKMFDYRGLIPMGLAHEAPEGMYNIKEE